MVPETKSFQLEIGGKTVTIETGKYAQSTNGSVTVRCGDTMLFVHCVVSKEPRVGIDFFPLLIDYEERMSSIGRIPGGYNRSEGKASDKAILVSRLIDRPIRPLFPKGYRNDIQIVAQLFSYDQQNQPDTLAMLGASCALMLTGAPFEGPIGAVRVSRDENGNLIQQGLLSRYENYKSFNLFYEQCKNKKVYKRLSMAFWEWVIAMVKSVMPWKW